MGTKSLILSFQNSFSASYFPLAQESLDQNNSLTPLLEQKLKALNVGKIKMGKIIEIKTLGVFFPNYFNGYNTPK